MLRAHVRSLEASLGLAGYYYMQNALCMLRKKARRGKQDNHKTGCNIFMCDTQCETAYGNGQMQI